MGDQNAQLDKVMNENGEIVINFTDRKNVLPPTQGYSQDDKEHAIWQNYQSTFTF